MNLFIVTSVSVFCLSILLLLAVMMIIMMICWWLWKYFCYTVDSCVPANILIVSDCYAKNILWAGICRIIYYGNWFLWMKDWLWMCVVGERKWIFDVSIFAVKIGLIEMCFPTFFLFHLLLLLLIIEFCSLVVLSIWHRISIVEQIGCLVINNIFSLWLLFFNYFLCLRLGKNFLEENLIREMVSIRKSVKVDLSEFLKSILLNVKYF